MISVATLDPATLALWFNPSAVTAPQNVEVCNDTLHLASGADLTSYSAYYAKLLPSEKAFSGSLASALWHEKRHFLDLILTNYGAYRVRQFFLVACNAMPVLKSIEGKIAFPFRVYTDPVRRRIAGVQVPSPALLKLIEEMSFRQELFFQEGRSIVIDGHQCEMGGDAQLEALAYSFQIGANQEWLCLEGAKLWQQGLGKAHQNTRYRWAELVAHAYGLLPTIQSRNGEILDQTLLIAVLYASLMMRAWGQDYSDPMVGTINVLPPYVRLRMLLDDLKGTSFPAASLSISDAWMLVNDRCKRLFGRTAIDELTADYELEGKWIDKLDKSEPGPTAFCDFHELRGKFIRILKHNPEQVLGLRQWSRELLPQLQPITVLANPSGVDGKPPVGMRAILEQTSASTKSWWWASILAPATTGYSLPHIDSWRFVLQYLSPLTKLMLSGRRHNLMIGPELLLMEHQLERLNYEIYFDGPFEFPDEGDDTDDYYRLTSRAEFKCDFCSTNIARGSGRLLGPWTIRRNSKLANACVAGLGGDQRALELFWKDWSHWHVCDNCIANMREHGVLEA